MTQYQPQSNRSNFFTVKAEASSTPPLATSMANSNAAAPGKVMGTPGPAGRISPEGSQVSPPIHLLITNLGHAVKSFATENENVSFLLDRKSLPVSVRILPFGG